MGLRVSWSERMGLEGTLDTATAAPLRVAFYGAVALGAWLELPAAAESGTLGVGLRLALAAVAVRAALGAGDRLDGPATFLLAAAAWGLGALPDTGGALLLVTSAALAGWDPSAPQPTRAPVTVARAAAGVVLGAFALQVLVGGLSSTPTGASLTAALGGAADLTAEEASPILDIGAAVAVALAGVAVAVPGTTGALRVFVWASVIVADLLVPAWRWGAAVVVALTVPPLPGLVETVRRWTPTPVPGWTAALASLAGAAVLLAVPLPGASLAAALVAATGLWRTRATVIQALGAFAGGASLLALHLATPTARDLHLQQARAAWDANHLDDARAAVDAALSAGPPTGEAYVLRADLRVLMGQLDRALTASGQALELGDDPAWQARRTWLLDTLASGATDADPLAYFEAACAAGDTDACPRAGATAPQSASDPEDPVVKLREACEAGAVAQCTALAELHMERVETPKHATRAAMLFERACGERHAPACLRLAAMLATGVGVGKDPPRAAQLYAGACDQQLGEACANLAFMHLEGRGVDRDPDRALALGSRGCDLGHALGCRIRDQLAD